MNPKKFVKRYTEKGIKKHEIILGKTTKPIKTAKIILLLILTFIYIFFSKYIAVHFLSNQKRVGVINVGNYQNVGTALVKYSMFKN